jgi:hypothetical protein
MLVDFGSFIRCLRSSLLPDEDDALPASVDLGLLPSVFIPVIICCLGYLDLRSTLCSGVELFCLTSTV